MTVQLLAESSPRVGQRVESCPRQGVVCLLPLSVGHCDRGTSKSVFGEIVTSFVRGAQIAGTSKVRSRALDMSPSEYAAAPTWHDMGVTPLPADATERVALSRS
jgi:hypothetical protein